MGRARPEISGDESYNYESTYPYLLRHTLEELYDVEIICMDSLDTVDARFWNTRIVAYKSPDIVLYHIGINDCAKRIFKKNTRFILFRGWFPDSLRRAALHIVNRYRRWLIRFIFRNKVYVSKDNFRTNINHMISSVTEFGATAVFGIGITIKPEWYEYRSPGINHNIGIYNTILKECFMEGFIDLDHLLDVNPSTHLISDGIHFTKETHRKAAEVLKDIFLSCVE